MPPKQEDRQFTDMIGALLCLHNAFAEPDIGKPAAIHLSTVEAGYRFERWLLTQRALLNYMRLDSRQTVAFDGQPWRQVELCGIKIRWPARVDALEGGGIRIA